VHSVTGVWWIWGEFVAPMNQHQLLRTACSPQRSGWSTDRPTDRPTRNCKYIFSSYRTVNTSVLFREMLAANSNHLTILGGGGLISLWLYNENNKLRDWEKKCIYSIYSPLSSTHLWLRCSDFFNTSKKKCFGCAENRKSQRLFSTPTYTWAKCSFL
jgi:hypothetical protein